MSAADPGGGFRVAGGPGPTVVDLEELAFAVRRLTDAADRLDAASWSLTRAAQACEGLSPAALEARHSLVAARDGPGSPWRAADLLRRLAVALRRVVEVYAQAESSAHRLLRVEVATGAGRAGETPGVAVLLGVGAVALGLAAVGMVAAGSVGRSVLLRRPDPVLVAARPALVRLTADGRAELAMLGVGAFVRSLHPGRQLPTLRPVPGGAATLFGPAPAAGPTALLVRAHPPQLPAPRTTAGVLANVARSYSTGAGLPGTPQGIVSVQRLTHPDGSRAWVIEIPGTESWRPNATTPMDLTTDGRLLAGLPDDLTGAVLEAMRLSGIGADEPVMLAGHSQGGMVAMSVAAAAGGTYAIRAVATAGTPDIPGPVPAGVEVRHYRHGEDVVPQLDGVPDATGAHVTVVTRELAAAGQGFPSPVEAHSVARYVETARLADGELAGSPGLRSFDAAAESVLGPPGTTAVTRQFQVTRDAVLAATQPPRLRPSLVSS
ncbi:hypothetical protein [Cellulomonas sp. ICMP 17802]|uniref:hypothetical protein n=1 Tax=Cellulomonas sp. ICMP 17802 TaxID=3239199 RepID=UPI00351BDD40